jgi:NAD(P)H dehydrogenase (quinone)
MKIAVAYHSEAGHTRAQAEAVARGAERAGASVTLVRVEELQQSRSGPWVELDEADAIVFGGPTHMGSASLAFEGFASASSWRWDNQLWKDKLAAGFTNGGNLSGDQMGALLRMAILAAQHGMIWVSLGQMPGKPTAPCEDALNLNRLGFYLGAGGQALPGEDMPASDLASAEALGARVAGLLEKMNG